MSYLTLTNELCGQIPGLDMGLARILINRSLSDINRFRTWSFNTNETVLIAPGLITGGSVSVTQYSNPGIVTGNSAATALWQAVGIAPVPLINQQFRVGSGPIYNIVAYDGVSQLTLDRIYTESTASGQAYSIYKCYYQVPSANFLRWVDVFDPINSYPFISTSWNKDDVDARDPQRGALSNPYYLAAYKPDNVITSPTYQVMQYEMWPHPTAAIGYLANYETNGTQLSSPSDLQPPAIPDIVVIEGAMKLACESMAQAAIANDKIATAQMWMKAAIPHQQTYLAELKKSAVKDEEAVLKNWVHIKANDVGVQTGAFWQSHDMAGVLGNY